MNINPIQLLFITYSVLCSSILTPVASASSLVPLPHNLKELVATSDIIITGEIGEIVKIETFYGYSEHAQEIAELAQQSGFPLGIPLVDFSITVDEIIMDDAEFPDRNTLILRTFQDHEHVLTPEAITARAGKAIFFLSRNPDNQTYGIHSIMHQLNIDECGKVIYSFEGKVFTPFGESIAASDFIERIKRVVAGVDTNEDHIVSPGSPRVAVEDYEGIWQAELEKTYYSIHQNEDVIVMIDLAKIATQGNTLASTYAGKDHHFMEVLGADDSTSLPIKIEFISNTEGIIIPICDVCSVITTKIIKIM